MKLLFLCTGNSCRSQMAEGLCRYLGSGEVTCWSAGTEPVGVNPRAVSAMAERGIDILGQTSKGLKDVPAAPDVVVTLCGDAADSCPRYLPATEVIHWPLPDPARARGSEAEVTASFRAVRDGIERRLRALLEERGLLAGPAEDGR